MEFRPSRLAPSHKAVWRSLAHSVAHKPLEIYKDLRVRSSDAFLRVRRMVEAKRRGDASQTPLTHEEPHHLSLLRDCGSESCVLSIVAHPNSRVRVWDEVLAMWSRTKEGMRYREGGCSKSLVVTSFASGQCYTDLVIVCRVLASVQAGGAAPASVTLNFIDTAYKELVCRLCSRRLYSSTEPVAEHDFPPLCDLPEHMFAARPDYLRCCPPGRRFQHQGSRIPFEDLAPGRREIINTTLTLAYYGALHQLASAARALLPDSTDLKLDVYGDARHYAALCTTQPERRSHLVRTAATRYSVTNA